MTKPPTTSSSGSPPSHQPRGGEEPTIIPRTVANDNTEECCSGISSLTSLVPELYHGRNLYPILAMDEATPAALARREMEALQGRFAGINTSTNENNESDATSSNARDDNNKNNNPLHGTNNEYAHTARQFQGEEEDSWLPPKPMPLPTPTTTPDYSNHHPRRTPGAHAVVGGSGPSSPPTVVLQADPDDSRNQARGSLVEATAIDNVGQAEPVHRRHKVSSRHRLAVLLSSIIIVVVAVITAVATTTSTARLEPADNTSKTNNNRHENDHTMHGIVPTSIIPPTPLFLAHLPNYTLRALLVEDTPQSRAYRWMVQDPNLEQYSLQRQIQRFALAVFYYSTGGPDWFGDVPLNNNGAFAVLENDNNNATNQTTMLSSTLGDDDDGWNTSTSNRRRRRSKRRELPFDPDGPRPYLYYKGFPLHGCRRRRRLLEEEPTVSRRNDTTSSTPVVPRTSLGFGSSGGECGFVSGASRWLDYSVHECDWYNQIDATAETTCDEGSVVANLYLSANGLVGTLPKQLALLTGMRRFFVDTNRLSGTVPLELFGVDDHQNNGGWSRIQDFWVRNNRLEGTIPSQLGRWKHSLERLNLFGNAFTGTIPSQLYGLSKLYKLALIQNRLTGSLQGTLLPGLRSLRLLAIGTNSLTGTLPTQLGLLSALHAMPAEGNAFTGTLPTQLGKLSRLEYLALGKNHLSGSLPSELGTTAMGLVLSLRGNARLTGVVPSDLGARSVMNVYLQDTGLTGTMPESWCNASKVLKWMCSSNKLCGCDCPCT